MRLFRTERSPGGKITQWWSEPNGTVHRKVTQDYARIFDAVHHYADQPRSKDWQLMGSVPETVAIQWCKELGPGYTLHSREFAQYARKKLQDIDYRKLWTGVT